MLSTGKILKQNPLQKAMTNAYRIDEQTAITALLKQIHFTQAQLATITETALMLATNIRAHKKKQTKIDSLLHHYDLSTEEGIALMCLAEALLRIPDKKTMDELISDKLSTSAWQKHMALSNGMFVNAATWSLYLTGKIYAPLLNQKNTLSKTLSKLSTKVIRPIILQMMKAIGNQFVMGETIDDALIRAEKIEKKGYTFSYDMLGEAARTQQEAETYYQSYVNAIHAIGKAATTQNPLTNLGISIKLSALHPRYEYTQAERVTKELTPKLLALAQLAKLYQIGLTVDAEEADRLDLSLDIIEKVFTDDTLNGYEGFGLAVQAYQKRAPFVIDWLIALCQKQKRRMMVRLVKGAYWDAEIKLAQTQGFSSYPLYTRKQATDLSYLVCAQKLLNHPECFYPQFGTHNAYSAAAIIEMAGDKAFEFQCLHGMGRPLYDQIISKHHCRIYAPVGTHKNLLGYLVRRLLENGANTSFINQLADHKTPIENMIKHPIAYMETIMPISHPHISLPTDIYKTRKNSESIDLSNRDTFAQLKTQLDKIAGETFTISSLIFNEKSQTGKERNIYSPYQTNLLVGKVYETDQNGIKLAIDAAYAANKTWSKTTVDHRAIILERAADLFEQDLPNFLSLLIREGGKCPQDAIAEIRETIDYCRYYAERARLDLATIALTGPTGESNQLSFHARGVIACISPWNFPLAIFTGQILAALVTGNTVIAKPSEQTPIVAYKAVELLHQAGIPKEVLQLVIGSGRTIGTPLVGDNRIAMVMFTGSTQTAKAIERTLANRDGIIAQFVAETGGQNAMIVDSSALAEQTVMDIALSAFNSAGQRCSALRVLFVQEEIAPKLLTMLDGYMQELVVGDPRLITTDIGPVIDENAKKMLTDHAEKMDKQAKLIAKVPMNTATDGYFFAPRAYEISDLKVLEGEVFGPILHVIRYQSEKLNEVLDAIDEAGFGLTLGIQSRIENTIQTITQRMHVGNMYVNRNMIGAVVGVQPFGGEGLSGTGPKAGGPHYLTRLCVERCVSINTTAVGGNASLVSMLGEGE